MSDLVKMQPTAEVEAWGEFARRSGVLPSGCNQFQAAAIVQTGRELGLAPMQSIRSMCFVNGRLTMTVQLQLALAKNKGVRIATLTETDDGCTVSLQRDGEKVTTSFTKADAEKAGLLRKDNWLKYGKQMYRWRAIGDALRLIAPDLVMGLLDPIEAETIEPPAPPPPPPPPAEQEQAYEEPEEKQPEPKKNQDYKYLKAMSEEKKRIGEEAYYRVLGASGFEHANDIEDRETKKSVYKAMKEEPDAPSNG